MNLSKTASQFNTSQVAFAKYKRLVLVLTQDQQTVAKLSFDKLQLFSNTFLVGQKVQVLNVNSKQTLTVRIMVEEESKQLNATGMKVGGANSIGGGGDGKLTNLGMAVI